MRLSFKKLFLRTLGRVVPSDFFSYRYPVSVKGVCFINNKVALLQNERRQWDLPGGKLKKREDIPQCLAREIREEMNIDVTVGPLLSATQVNVMDSIDVLVLIYSCFTQASAHQLKISPENFALRLFSVEELSTLHLPKAYYQAIRKAFHDHVLNGR